MLSAASGQWNQSALLLNWQLRASALEAIISPRPHPENIGEYAVVAQLWMEGAARVCLGAPALRLSLQLRSLPRLCHALDLGRADEDHFDRIV